MKKLFLSVMIMLLGGGCLFAQNTIEVWDLKVEAGTVTFNVKWPDAGASNLWSDTVWVFVDYNKNGKMTRLPLLSGSGATLTATSSPGVGKLEEVSGNTKGAWVVGDARMNSPFSATVQLIADETTIAGACAYASSYPPVGQYVSESEIVFSGTPMYEIKLLHSDGYTVETIESGSTFLLPCDYTMSSFTDATGAPGIIKCLAPTGLTLTANPETICAGATVTLTASATGASSYSINGNDWYPSPVFEVTPTSTTSYTLYAQTEAECVGSVADAAVVSVLSAASTQTWVFGSRTWSDRIVANPSNCSSTTTLSKPPPSAQYLVGSNGRYYYNWTCVDAAQATLCPYPWRVPLLSDFNTLISALGGNIQTARDALKAAWEYGGDVGDGTIYGETSRAWYWSLSGSDINGAYGFTYTSTYILTQINQIAGGFQVRCVK